MTGGSNNSKPQKHVVIAGAGVAGLTAALALAGKGFTVTLCERADSFSEVGAGLQLSPNVTRLLKRLGVLEPLLTRATVTKAIALLSAKSGETLLSLSATSAPQTDGAPFLAVHRADLQSVLAAKALETPGIAIKSGLTFQSADDTGGKIGVTFLHGDAPLRIEADVLIGADGVWSMVRGTVPGHSATRHSGYTAWRATIPVSDALPAAFRDLCRNQTVGAFLSPGAHLVAYPLRQGSLLNLVLVTPGTDSTHGWDNSVDLAVLAQTLEQFEPSLRNCLASITNWRSWPLHGCPPEGAWTSGRIALTGDAAHAMTPFAAQGACMAIEDAIVLANCLAKNDDVPSALAAYETLRKPRVTKVIARGKFNRFAYHVSGPAAFARNAVFALRGQKLMAELDWLYRFDAGSV